MVHRGGDGCRWGCCVAVALSARSLLTTLTTTTVAKVNSNITIQQLVYIS